MRTREELLELIKTNAINESKLSEDEFNLITGDDFSSALDALKFLRANKEYEKKELLDVK